MVGVKAGGLDQGTPSGGPCGMSMCTSAARKHISVIASHLTEHCSGPAKCGAMLQTQEECTVLTSSR